MRFHRDDKSWLRDPKVFVDMGRPMPDSIAENAGSAQLVYTVAVTINDTDDVIPSPHLLPQGQQQRRRRFLLH